MTQTYSTRTIRCGHCDFAFPRGAPGTRHRNHCPVCLWSRHLDAEVPGDRAAACRGLMEPIAVSSRPDGEWTVVHRCRRCDTLARNRIAGDDDPVALLALAVRPLARPPFPLDLLLGQLRATTTTIGVTP